ncbi:RNA methyltransferase, TrmH family, group 1 [Burkholderia thailandensis E264]|uniref:tRNA (cytidine/uridine-2'-O-)-methyltransferase TrmJ n=3 Tax=Burkholderia thailandensis TaxID=57975 RepID=Q2SX84_BURTA|nr:RNA methyltransferase, TrmH family, group 1 [Burkholderia thailandensis E264]
MRVGRACRSIVRSDEWVCRRVGDTIPASRSVEMNVLESQQKPSAPFAGAATSRPARAARGGFTSTRFVLVEPSHPGNVGAAARALKTMGFSRLVLVAPRVPCVQSDPEALAMASGADDVLASAHVVPTLADALNGVQWSLALTARSREYGPPRLAPRAAAASALQQVRTGDIAFVFGNERTGLSNEHVERCSAIAHIPANPAYSSLNLAQAVQVLAYELRVALLEDGEPATPPDAALGARAQSDEIERMFVHLENALIALDFLDPRNPKKLMPRLRRLFARTGLEREEVNIVRGIAKHILLRAGGTAARAGASGDGESDPGDAERSGRDAGRGAGRDG